ncbi:MAG: DUF6879 family protein [Pseudonocardiaceae bacterium]
MNLDEFIELFRRFRSTAVRLETLQRYEVEHEAADLAQFEATGQAPSAGTPDDDEWLRLIADGVASGKKWERMRAIRQPLSSYLRFEMHIYGELATAGERIYIVDLGTDPRLVDDLRQDWWLFDDETLVRLHYDDRGRFLDVEHVTTDIEIEGARQQHELAARFAVPLHSWIREQQSSA